MRAKRLTLVTDTIDTFCAAGIKTSTFLLLLREPCGRMI